ncbi:MATE family efflux transporter [Cupriavidus sp. 8B]
MTTSGSAPLRASNPRLRSMLEAPIVPTVLRMSVPNMLMMLAQASTGLIETWFLAKLGTDVLAGVAVVIPVLMLMGNMSQGAMGGGISAAVARALGAGNQTLINQIPRHALAINVLIGVAFAAMLLTFQRSLFSLIGAKGAALDAACTYGRVLFAGLPLMWAMNALASVIRGTGNMSFPGMVICGGAVALVPLSPCLIFGWGPIPQLGVAGGAWALVLYYAAGTAILGWFCLSGRCAAQLVGGAVHWLPIRSILVVGALACINPVLTNALIAITTAQVGGHGGTAALAGYATGARLEYLLIPIAFGFGAPMVALVGANIGAGQIDRARRIALIGGFIAFSLAELIGLVAAFRPSAWLRLFGGDEHLLEAGVAYLQMVGPFYGCFALGFSLYFASQGAGRLKWPLVAGALRLTLFAGVGGFALSQGASLQQYFSFGALAMLVYGTFILWAVAKGNWGMGGR